MAGVPRLRRLAHGVSGPVRMVARKWPDRPHWEHRGVRLGEDRHGVWVGTPVGTTISRPKASFVTDQAIVTVVPRTAPFTASFYARGGTAHCEVYVDITTVPVWVDEGTVVAVDLDLDVVRGWTGRVWVDDEDEFADHRVRFGYPDELSAAAMASCDRVHAAVAAGAAPYDGSAALWLDRVPVER